MLATANQEYDQQQLLAALAVAEADRIAPRGDLAVAQTIQTYQAAAVALSLETLPDILAEQGIAATATATVLPYSLLTISPVLVGMLQSIRSTNGLARLTRTMVGDASRTARAVDAFTRPAVTGYVRFLRPPSCSDCVILAGRVYTHSQGFDRHPNDDCGMVPTDHAIGPDLVIDPMEAFRRGWISDLSEEDAKAVEAGANLTKTINAHRTRGSVAIGTSVLGRTSPQEVIASIQDRLAAFMALRAAGFIATP